MKKLLLFSLILAFTFPTEMNAQRKKSKKNNSEETAAKPQKSKTPKYADFVTKKTSTDDGLFKVHNTDNKFMYEIPKAHFGKEMLLVTRIKDIPAGLGGGYVNAGSKINTQVVVWEEFQDKILLKVKSYDAVANDSLPIYKSVKANNLEPILFAFDIATQNQDSTAVLVDVTKFFTSDIQAISPLPDSYRKRYKVRRLDASRSFINSIKSYPENIEVVQDFTFDAAEPPSNSSTNTITIRVNQSMIVLPEDKMMPRVYDKRVGYFSIGNVDYSSEALKADDKRYIRRWRLEPKDINVVHLPGLERRGPGPYLPAAKGGQADPRVEHPVALHAGVKLRDARVPHLDQIPVQIYERGARHPPGPDERDPLGPAVGRHLELCPTRSV